MDPYIPGLITAACVGALLGMMCGWYGAFNYIRKQNQRMAQQMAASVGATRSRRPVENMMDYDNRQRTLAENNGQKARQGNVVFRPRRMMRRR